MTVRWDVIRSEAASADLEEIWRYLYPIDEELADRFLDRLEDTFSKLTEFPERHSLREAVAPGLRGVMVGPWLVLYRIDHTRTSVQITRVLDARRNLAGLISI